MTVPSHDDNRTNGPPPPKCGPNILPALALVIALGTALRLYLLVRAHATEEDFYITLRYARNIGVGSGFVFNPGEHVLGTTTPLYTLFLALLIRLNLDPVLGGKTVGLLADAITCFVVFRLGRAVGRPGAGIAAAILVATLPTNLTWATKGMEVGIVAAAATTAWMCWAERREAWAWAAAAILVLLRIDGLALVIVLLAASLIREQRIPWRGLVVYSLLTAPWLVFATLYFGSPIPASLRAKMIVYGHYATTALPRLGSFLSLMLHSAGALVALGAAAAAGACVVSLWHARKAPADPPRPEWTLAAPALWVAVYYAGMAFSKVFLFGWYFVPPTPIYYLVSMVGWSVLLERLLRHRRAATIRHLAREITTIQSMIVAGTITATLGGLYAPHVLADMRSTQRVEDGLRIPIARWLRANAGPNDRVMLEPIGYIGYYSGMRILDSVGLVSPEVLPYWRRDVTSPLHSIWSRFLPQWILLRNGERQALERDEAGLPRSDRLTAHYTLIRSWTDPAFPGAHPSFYLYHRLPRGPG